MDLHNVMVLIHLISGHEISGRVLSEDQYTITLREGPNPDYSSKPPIIIQRVTIETIQILQ